MAESNEVLPMMDEAYWDAVGAVQVVNVCEVLDEVVPAWAKNYDYQANTKAVQGWVAKHDAHFYSEDRENFSTYEAKRQAHDAGKKLVVVEDLS